MRLNLEKMHILGISGKIAQFLLDTMGNQSEPRQMPIIYGVPHSNIKEAHPNPQPDVTLTVSFRYLISSTRSPFLQTPEERNAFEWSDKFETTLDHLKNALSQPLVLFRPYQGETFYV